MRKLTILGFGLLACSPLFGEEATELELMLSACAGCHGSQGQGNSEQGAPALAGQLSEYLSRQLAGFRDGRRGGHPADLSGADMSGASVGMSDEQIQALASHYAQMPPPVDSDRAPTDQADADGEIYRNACGHCHGENGEGYAALGAPRLDILSAAYLRRQMDSYASGRRGVDPDADLQSLWMHDVAAHEGNREILERAIDYIAVDGNPLQQPSP